MDLITSAPEVLSVAHAVPYRVERFPHGKQLFRTVQNIAAARLFGVIFGRVAPTVVPDENFEERA